MRFFINILIIFHAFIISYELLNIDAQCSATIASFETTANTQLISANRQDYYVSLTIGDLAPTSSAVIVRGSTMTNFAAAMAGRVLLVGTKAPTVVLAVAPVVTMIPTTPAVIPVTTTTGTPTGDVPTGTGCRTVLVEGLDSSGNEASETVTLSPTIGSAVNTVATFSWLQRISCATVGTNLANVAPIFSSFGGVEIAIESVQVTPFFTPSNSNSYSARYKVPTSKRATLRSLLLTTSRDGAVTGTPTYFYLRSQASATSPILTWNTFVLKMDGTSMSQYIPLMNVVYPAGTVVWIEFYNSAVNTAANTIRAMAEMDFLLTT